jgi:hypothetical protein
MPRATAEVAYCLRHCPRLPRVCRRVETASPYPLIGADSLAHLHGWPGALRECSIGHPDHADALGVRIAAVRALWPLHPNAGAERTADRFSLLSLLATLAHGFGNVFVSVSEAPVAISVR